MKRTGARLLGAAGAGLACLAAAAFYLGATPARLAGSISPDPGDPILNLYLLRWGAHQIASGLPSPWDANFFHPLHGTLALSDHLFGPSAAFLLAEAAGATPALGYNLILLSSFALGGAVLFWIGTACGLSRGSALVGSFVWSFSLTRWQELPHLQVLLSQWLPALLWSFDRLLVKRTPRAAALFVAAYALHTLGGAYLAYMAHLGLAVIALVRWRAEGRGFWRREGMGAVATAGAIAVAIGAAVFVPYLQLRSELGVRTWYTDLDPRRTTLVSLVTPGVRSRVAGWLPPFEQETPRLWLGFVPLLLLVSLLGPARARFAALARGPGRGELVSLVACAVAILGALVACDAATLRLSLNDADEREILKSVYRWSGAVVVVGVVLARRLLARCRPEGAPVIDPWWRSLAWIAALSAFAAHPSGYFLLQKVVPGFGSLRVPSRFAELAATSIALGVALAVDRLSARLGPVSSPRRLAVPVVVLAAFAWETTPVRHLDWFPVEAPKEFPAAARWLAENGDGGAQIELPLLGDWREARRMYFTTLRFQPLVNGYSGYVPPLYTVVQHKLANPPSPSTLAWLRDELGVEHVVVHLDAYTKVQRRGLERWRGRVAKVGADSASLLYEDDDTWILRLGPERSRSRSPG